MYRSAAKSVLLWCAVVSVSSMEKTSMYMKKSEVNDQAMSGTGYFYNGKDAKPQEYSFELGDNDHSFKVLDDLGYDPFVENHRYAEENLPLPYEQYPNEYSKNAAVKPVAFLVNDNSYKLQGAKVRTPSLFPQVNEYRKLGVYPVAYPYAAGYNHTPKKSFLKQVGRIYGDSGSSKRGDKFDSGYRRVDAFDKGLKGRYGNQDAKSYYGLGGGRKKLAFDNAGNYAVRNDGGKASLGGSFGRKDSHNKGSKTTGFSKTYRKDDYDKQHKFYDKADRRGHFNRYGDFNAKNDNAEGRFAEGGRKNEGFEGDKYGLSDFSDKGHLDEISKVFRKADGKDGFYKDYAGYSKKGGNEKSSLGGYSI